MTAVLYAAQEGHTATAMALVRTVQGEEIAAGGEGAAVGSVMTRASTRMMTMEYVCESASVWCGRVLVAESEAASSREA